MILKCRFYMACTAPSRLVDNALHVLFLTNVIDF